MNRIALIVFMAVFLGLGSGCALVDQLGQASEILEYVEIRAGELEAKLAEVKTEYGEKIVDLEANVGALDVNGDGDVTVEEVVSIVKGLAVATPFDETKRKLLFDPWTWIVLLGSIFGIKLAGGPTTAARNKMLEMLHGAGRKAIKTAKAKKEEIVIIDE